MKKIIGIAIFIIGSLLAGCNQLTSYTINEQDVNLALEKYNHFSKDIGVPGIAQAHIILRNLSSHIGREEPDRVTLNGDAQLDMSSLFGNQNATIKLTLKALPVFNREEGAIYLEEMEVVSAQAEPEKMQSVLQTIVPYLNQSLHNYFNRQPAYILSDNRSRGESLARKMAKGIEIKPGKIVVPFTD